MDVALIQVSPPDRHGHVSLGVSVDVSIDAVHHAKFVVAQINPNMPRAHGTEIFYYLFKFSAFQALVKDKQVIFLGKRSDFL